MRGCVCSCRRPRSRPFPIWLLAPQPPSHAALPERLSAAERPRTRQWHRNLQLKLCQQVQSLDATSLRIDRTIGDRLTIFGRYNYSPSENVQRGGTGYSLSLVAPSRIITQTGTAGATWKFSDRSVNDFRFNFSRTNAQSSDSIDSFGGAVPLPSLPFPSPYSVGNAQLFVDIFSLTGGYLVAGANLTSNLDQINLVDSLSLERGTHSWKFGGDFRRLSTRYSPYLYGQAAFFADVPSTANGVLDFSSVEVDAGTTIHFYNLSLFAQDTWLLLRAPQSPMAYAGTSTSRPPRPTALTSRR